MILPPDTTKRFFVLDRRSLSLFHQHGTGSIPEAPQIKWFGSETKKKLFLTGNKKKNRFSWWACHVSQAVVPYSAPSVDETFSITIVLLNVGENAIWLLVSTQASRTFSGTGSRTRARLVENRPSWCRTWTSRLQEPEREGRNVRTGQWMDSLLVGLSLSWLTSQSKESAAVKRKLKISLWVSRRFLKENMNANPETHWRSQGLCFRLGPFVLLLYWLAENSPFPGFCLM